MNSIFVKYVYLMILDIICSFTFQNLNAQQLLWQKVFDTGVEDYTTEIAADIYGNFIVTGRSALQTSSGSCLTIKYDQYGDTIWTRWYNINSNDITTDNHGNIIIAGDMWDVTTNADIHIIKCDPDGKLLWARTYSNGMKGVCEFAYGVLTDSKCNIIVTGRGTSLGHLPNYITLKYDSSGNIIWMREYDGGYIDCAQDVAVDDSDNVIVTGYSDSNINWDWCKIKYSPDGDIIWVSRHDVSLTDCAHSVTTDNLVNVIVAGETRYLPGSGGATGMLVKYSTSGDTLWSKIFTYTLKYSKVARFVDVATDKDGNIYLAGDYVQWDTSGKLWFDYYIVKCNSAGDTLWTALYDFNVSDEPSAIALDKDGNIIVTGTTSSNPHWGEYDYLTVKLHNTITVVNKENILPYQCLVLQNYPNPFNPTTTIIYQIPDKCFISLKIYDLLGREIETLVKEEKLAGVYTVRWNAVGMPSGVYFYRLLARPISGGQVSAFTDTKKLLLLK